MSVNVGNFTSELVAASALTSTQRDLWILTHTSSGSVGPEFGSSIKWRLEDASNNITDAGYLTYVWDNPTTAQVTAKARIRVSYPASTGIIMATPVDIRADRTLLNPYDVTAGSTHQLWFSTLAASGKVFSLQAQDSMAADVFMKLPNAHGTNGQSMVWTTGGILSFATRENPITVTSPIVRIGDTFSCPTCTQSINGVITSTGVLFSNLGTPANGTIVPNCTDCGQSAGICTGGGTGGPAYRVNGVWKCPIS
jgi:hypothetical protein